MIKLIYFKIFHIFMAIGAAQNQDEHIDAFKMMKILDDNDFGDDFLFLSQDEALLMNRFLTSPA